MSTKPLLQKGESAFLRNTAKQADKPPLLFGEGLGVGFKDSAALQQTFIPRQDIIWGANCAANLIQHTRPDKRGHAIPLSGQGKGTTADQHAVR